MEHRNYLLFFFIIITRSRGKGEVGGWVGVTKRWGSEGTEESSVVFLKNKGIYYFCDFFFFSFSCGISKRISVKFLFFF